MSDVLVAYFSASGVTKGVAERLAASVGADLFEIEPEEIYTSADLNWQDKSSRSSVEMDNPASRPKIKSKVDDMSKYSFVFIGFPVWWYREPSIIDTFVESYDFSGKTIIPFATSGSSQIGKSGENMGKIAQGATVLEGKRFASGVSEDELGSWAKSII